MRILGLEPFYGGSHKAFLDGWIARSRHEWSLIGLPAYKWKWRMRHAAVTMSDQVTRRTAAGERWDVLFCSDMLNLAEFLGLAPAAVRDLPRVAYFHENQLTYPVREQHERDNHFAFTNITTALAATEVWFNSGYHRESMLGALPPFLKRMPDHQPLEAVDRIAEKTRVCYPGVSAPSNELHRREDPQLRGYVSILWSARWEHDKDPASFFQALDILANRGVVFRLSVIGEQFSKSPAVFEEARRRFDDAIDHWGYQASRAVYERVLAASDIVVSTAVHEFFGLGVVEAVSRGVFPVLPSRLAYPEVLGTDRELRDACLYDGSVDGLVERLAKLIPELGAGGMAPSRRQKLLARAGRFYWETVAADLDRALEAVAIA